MEKTQLKCIQFLGQENKRLREDVMVYRTKYENAKLNCMIKTNLPLPKSVCHGSRRQPGLDR